MKYILNPGIALRGWQLVPFAYYMIGSQRAYSLTPEDYFFLASCDGKTEIEHNPTVCKYLHKGFIFPAKEGDELSNWQKPRFCDNRYFPKANWAITGYCNYNCKHCYNAADDNEHPKFSFSLEECKKLVQELDDCGVQCVTLTGGEPMLHPHFMDIVKDVVSRGMELYHINTNGSLITDEILEELKEIGANPLMKISFDCLTHHEWMRGVKGAEEQTLKAIELCKKHGFRVRVQTCVHRLNIDTLFETAVKLAKMGVEEIRIIRTSEAPRWEKNAGDACFPIDEYYELMLDFAEKFAKTGLKMEIDLWQFLYFSPSEGFYHYRPCEGGVNNFRENAPVCRGNRAMIAINSDGSLVPCNQMSGYFSQNNYELGNVKKQSLRELLTDSKYLKTVTCPISAITNENEKCKNCKYLKYCAGGCRAIALVFTRNYLGIDPSKCMFFKGHYMKRIDEMFERVKKETGIEYKNIDDVLEEDK